ncbi:unnamed protein product [Schistosoma margrebowiei]|uniref:Uncharacterized protein n=1 Tax=Schistosoma margrebowiei TaxID=48269 RepID=A0A183LPA3_9TREM|nr:unnamed protein product [Schistosoma margrebowiei]
MKRLYDSTKKLAGRCNIPERLVKDKNGKPITEIQRQRNRWLEFFEELRNRPAPMNPSDVESTQTDLPIDFNPPTTKEIRMAIRRIKSRKAAGPENNNPITLDDETLEDVEPFTYLGIIIDEQGGSDADVRNAVLALPILAFASAPDHPCSSMMLPRYVKDSTSSRVSSSRVIGFLFSVLYLKTLVFLLCMLSPTDVEVAAILALFICICSCVWDRRAKPSAKSKSPKQF